MSDYPTLWTDEPASPGGGWLVYASPSDKPRHVAKWRAISRRFELRQAADQFAALAARQMPEARIEVRAATRGRGK